MNGPNSYGTHDWILDQALSALGHKADWVCAKTALRATDAVDLLLDVLTKWADHPSKHTRQWSAAYKPSVQALEELRFGYRGASGQPGVPVPSAHGAGGTAPIRS